MANDEEPAEKALGASPSVAVTSEDRFNTNLALMVESGASGHYFDDAIIRDVKHRLQDYVHLTTPRKILTAGGAKLDGTAEGVRQALSPTTTATKSSFGSLSWWCPGLGVTYFR